MGSWSGGRVGWALTFTSSLCWLSSISSMSDPRFPTFHPMDQVTRFPLLSQQRKVAILSGPHNIPNMLTQHNPNQDDFEIPLLKVDVTGEIMM
jgi:hypothetical protein